MLQTVCAFWLRGMCMKGESCGFLHKLVPERMPVCRVWMKTGAYRFYCVLACERESVCVCVSACLLGVVLPWTSLIAMPVCRVWRKTCELFGDMITRHCWRLLHSMSRILLPFLKGLNAFLRVQGAAVPLQAHLA
jgi:hypothetical protein